MTLAQPAFFPLLSYHPWTFNQPETYYMLNFFGFWCIRSTWCMTKGKRRETQENGRRRPRSYCCCMLLLYGKEALHPTQGDRVHVNRHDRRRCRSTCYYDVVVNTTYIHHSVFVHGVFISFFYTRGFGQTAKKQRASRQQRGNNSKQQHK